MYFSTGSGFLPACSQHNYGHSGKLLYFLQDRDCIFASLKDRGIPLGLNVWFQIISILSPQRELEIPKGRGVKDPGNSEGEDGCKINLVLRSYWKIVA